MKTCVCPVPTVIPTLSAIDPCPVNTGQIQRLIFVDRGTEYVIASLAANTYWAAKQISIGTDRCVFSPLIGNPEFEPGDVSEFGGGNETLNGVPLVVGLEPTTFTFRFYSLQKGMAAELKDMACREVDVFLVNENNQIVYNEKSTTTATGFPIRQFSVSDRRIGGYSEPDYNNGKIMFSEDWSDNFTMTKEITSWNPLSI
ncbi:MAG: hypothetical protein EOL88_02320 [Bacteroidia bacterium]|nr:hypothetical protein [Bacteroidia bacterium]